MQNRGSKGVSKKKDKDYDYNNGITGCRCYDSTGNPCEQQNGNGQVKNLA